MTTPIELLQIALEKLEIEWQMWQVSQVNIEEHTREYHTTLISEYEKAINILVKEKANEKYRDIH